MILKHRPEWKPRITKCHKQYLEAKKGQLNAYITDVVTRLEPHIGYLAQFDENIFSEDYGELELIPGLNVKPFWDTDYSEQIKGRFWNYFQKLYLSGRLFLNPRAIRDPLFRTLLENLQLDRIVEDSVKHDELVNPETQPASLMSDLDSEAIKNILGENSIFAELSKEIVKELPDSIKNATNPLDMITGLFGNDGQTLKGLIQKMSQRIGDKLESGEISQEKLLQSAQEMTQKIEQQFPQLHEVVKDIGQLAEMGKEMTNGEVEELLHATSEMVEQQRDASAEVGEAIGDIEELPNSVVYPQMSVDKVPEMHSVPDTLDELQAIKNLVRSRRAPRNKEI